MDGEAPAPGWESSDLEAALEAAFEVEEVS